MQKNTLKYPTLYKYIKKCISDTGIRDGWIEGLKYLEGGKKGVRKERFGEAGTNGRREEEGMEGWFTQEFDSILFE